VSRRAQGGLTLLEVLIALALLGLMVAVAYPGLRTIVLSWLRGADRANDLEEVVIVERFVRQEIEQAMPVYQTDGGRSTLVFRGDAGRVELVAPLPQLRAMPGLYHLTFTTVDSRAGRRTFGMRYRLWNAGNDEVVDKVLFEGISALRFEFQAVGAKTWSPVWPASSRLPARVRVTLDRSDRRWTWDIPVRAQAAAFDAPSS